MPQTAKLSVGINKYPDAPLRGCLNDLEHVDAQLYNLGMKPAASTVITDRQATAAAIRAGLEWLIARPEPRKVFHYSGHGARLRDTSGDEKFDSALVPWDYDQAGFILDDELASYYDRVPAGHRLIILSDSCHSGGSQRSLIKRFAARAGLMSAPRALPAHLVNEQSAQASREALMEMVRRYLQKHAPRVEQLEEVKDKSPWLGMVLGRPRQSFIESASRAVLIAVCKPDQTAADAHIDGKWQGAGTAALLAAWNQFGRLATYADIAKSANAYLKFHGYNQVLRVEAPAAMKKLQFFS